MKKVFVLLMVVVLSLSMFIGCSNNNENENMNANEDMNANDDSAEEVDVVTTASIVTDADAFVSALSADGTWIAAALNDIVLEEALVVEGEFTNKDAPARKIGLYTQDADHVIIDRFTLTVPSITVKSENLSIKGGVVKGDIYVEANGFSLSEVVIEGNIYFASQEYKDSFVMDEENSEVTGSMEVQ